jgi:hypothetical protein
MLPSIDQKHATTPTHNTQVSISVGDDLLRLSASLLRLPVRRMLTSSCRVFSTNQPASSSAFADHFWQLSSLACHRLFHRRLYRLVRNRLWLMLHPGHRVINAMELMDWYRGTHNSNYRHVIPPGRLKKRQKSVDMKAWLRKHWVYTEVVISPKPSLLPDIFCLMVRIFRLMLVLLCI